MTERSRRRSWLFGALTALLGLALLEGTLQVAAALVRHGGDRSRSLSESDDRREVRILCIGDSHTFGLPLPREDSYPAQLERALARRYPDYRVSALNFGLPSLNSSYVANRLERQIYQTEPDLVIVWVGINNLWNVIERSVGEGSVPALGMRQALMRLRLFRLASLVWFNVFGERYDPALRGGYYAADTRPAARMPSGVAVGDPAPGLARDVERMVSITRLIGTPVILLTYPLKTQTRINRVILQSGGRLGVPVIDTHRILARAFRDGHLRGELIDERAGPHPSRLLYAYIVEALEPVVVEELQAWHGLRALPHSNPPRTPAETAGRS